MSVAVGVGEGVKVFEGTFVGRTGVVVGVLVGRTIILVLVAVGVFVKTSVGASVGVLVGTSVDVFVGILVGVAVSGSTVTSSVDIGVGVGDGSVVTSSVDIGVFDGWTVTSLVVIGRGRVLVGLDVGSSVNGVVAAWGASGRRTPPALAKAACVKIRIAKMKLRRLKVARRVITLAAHHYENYKVVLPLHQGTIYS